MPVQAQPDPSLNVRVEQKLGSSLPLETPFVDQYGGAVTLGCLLHNRPAVILPIFYRCHGVCSIETQNLIGSLGKMKLRVGKDLDVIFLSIDPQEGPALAMDKFKSTMPMAANFAGTDAGWHFLTGKYGDIRRLTDALGFYFTYDAASDVVNHPSALIFVDPSGKVSSYLLDYNYTPIQITHNVEVAAAHKVGEKSTDAFFGCIHVDPLTGKRSIVIQKVLSLAGLATVIVLVASIAVLSFRGRKK